MKKIIAKRLTLLLTVSVICASATTCSLAEETVLLRDGQQLTGNGAVLALAEGKESSFIVTMERTLWSMGRNERGQLGTGNFESTEEFVEVMEDVVNVSAGYEHTAAVKSDGALYLWGSNEEGQLGSGYGKDQAAPQLVLENAVQVSAGGFHTLAVSEDGTLWAWGSNASGSLGTGNENTEYRPVKVMNNVTESEAGWYFSAAVKEDGSLWTWGWNEKGRLGNGTTKDSYYPQEIMEDVTAIAIGPSHGLALKGDGTLWAWGDNGYGQLGDGTRENRYNPVMVMDQVEAISAGYYGSAAIKTDGSLWIWGTNKGLWLGSEGKEASSVPIEVKENAVLVDLGRSGSLIATKDGRIYLDSLNSNQQAEIREGRPVLLENMLTVKEHNKQVYSSKRSDQDALDYYLQATDNIQSDDVKIQTLAVEITKDLETDSEKLKEIHDWVCSNLYYNYDAYYFGASRGDISAVGALSEESTICSGYSNLMAALLRASGIPTKYISGYATSRGGRELLVEEIAQPGNAHAWNEVWIDGRWVIVDSTWDCKNKFHNGQLTGLPLSREYLDPDLEMFSYTHMIKEYTEYMIP